MGREIRRVPLDFEWELNKIWKGFLNPHFRPCPEDQKICFNGETAAGQWLTAILRLVVVAADDALDGGRCKARGGLHPHPYLVNLETAPTYEVPRELKGSAAHREIARRMSDRSSWVLPLTQEMVDLVSGYDKASFLGFLGGSALYEMRKKLIKGAKLDPKTWGICPVCKGESIDPGIKDVYEAWKPEAPPKGEGWQLWETVSEGSPISPVLPTREAFIEYLMDQGSTRSAAEAFTKQGWVPSGVSVGNGPIVSGIEAAEVMQRE